MFTANYTPDELLTIPADRAFAIIQDQIDLGKISKRQALGIAAELDLHGPDTYRWFTECGGEESGIVKNDLPDEFYSDTSVRHPVPVSG